MHETVGRLSEAKNNMNARRQELERDTENFKENISGIINSAVQAFEEIKGTDPFNNVNNSFARNNNNINSNSNNNSN